MSVRKCRPVVEPNAAALLLLAALCGALAPPPLVAQTPALLEVPAPLSASNPQFRTTWPALPAPGEAYVDPDFGTRQTRVVSTLQLRHEYSRHDPFNADRSLVLLLYLPEGEWRVYRTSSTPYDQSGSLLASVQLEEPRWDPVNPWLLWGTRGLRVISVDLTSGVVETVHKDFAQDATIAPVLTRNPDIYRVTMLDEGESSSDKRYWAFVLQGSAENYRARFILSWDLQQDRVLGLYEVAADQADIDWVGMSPLGNWVLIGGSERNAGVLAGLVMANRELDQFHRIDYATAHADVGLDSDGREVIVMQNVRTDHVDLIPLDPATQPILEPGGSYAGTGRVPLVRLNYASDANGLVSGVHVSCNAPGLCVISTTTEPGLGEQNWLDRKIVLTTLDRARPRTFYLARNFGSTASYWEETHATVTRDGSRVVWATNWSQDVGQDRVWLQELQLPTGSRRAQPVWHEWFAVDALETPFVGDFDGDARTDIITFTRQNPLAVGDVYVALSQGNRFGANTKWHDWFAIHTSEQVVIGDFDGDGREDIGTWLAATTRQVYVALSYGSGMRPEAVWTDQIGFDSSDVLAAGDVNGDGLDDLVLFARRAGTVHVALSDGTRFARPVEWHGYFAVSTFERPRVADVTGDGLADIVTFATDSPTATGDVYVAVSDGARFVDLNGRANSSTKWHDWFAVRPDELVRVGDLDGDGRQDFFTFLPLPFAQCYTVLSQGTSMGPNVLWREKIGIDARDALFAGDASGDGHSDVIIFAQGEGRVYVSLAP